MSVTETGIESGPGGMLNTPPHIPGMPPIPPPTPPSRGPAVAPPPQTPSDVAAAIARVGESGPPEFPDGYTSRVELPGGWISPTGELVTTASVRELTGYDEERMARQDLQKNVAIYVTKLLAAGVEEIGGEEPTEDLLRQLLIGDREHLVLGIRMATYGRLVPFTLTCVNCGNDSAVEIELDKDLTILKLDDPRVREFDVPLRHGKTAKVTLLTGAAQEAYSDDIGRKTEAEVTTLMLAKSVTEIDGRRLRGNPEDVRALPAADRATLADFIASHRCGPQFEAVNVPCATCGEEYPISLGLSNLFRL